MKYFSTRDVLIKESKSLYFKKKQREILKAVKDYLPSGSYLDIGVSSPLSEHIEKTLGINFDHTQGDLDFEFICSEKKYDLVLFSHTIEHVMNPLFVVMNIKKVMNDGGILIIAHPVKLRTSRDHFHEIPIKRLYDLLDKAGLEIVETRSFLIGFYRHLMGIRPLLRFLSTLFYDRHYITIGRKHEK